MKLLLLSGLLSLALTAGAMADDLADAIEALFLGSGPLADHTGGLTGCPDDSLSPSYHSRLSRFAPGDVRVVFGGSVGTSARAVVETVLRQAETVSGMWRFTTERALAGDPIPGLHEIAVARVHDPRLSGCPSAAGCMRVTAWSSAIPWEILSARVVMPDDQAAVRVHRPRPRGHPRRLRCRAPGWGGARPIRAGEAARRWAGESVNVVMAVTRTPDRRFLVTVLCLPLERFPGMCVHVGLAIGLS